MSEEKKVLKVKEKPKHYVDNVKFLECIIKYREKIKEAKELGLEKPRIPEYAGACLQKIAVGLSYSPKFINYSFRQEMISDAIENSILYFDGFNPEKGTNPFAYFTQIMYYAFIRRISKEEKLRYTTYKYFDSTMMGTELADLMRDDNNNLVHEPIYDNISDFISRYEEKDQKRREKKKALLEEKKGLAKFYKDDDDFDLDKVTDIIYDDEIIQDLELEDDIISEEE